MKGICYFLPWHIDVLIQLVCYLIEIVALPFQFCKYWDIVLNNNDFLIADCKDEEVGLAHFSLG